MSSTSLFLCLVCVCIQAYRVDVGVCVSVSVGLSVGLDVSVDVIRETCFPKHLLTWVCEVTSLYRWCIQSCSFSGLNQIPNTKYQITNTKYELRNTKF